MLTEFCISSCVHHCRLEESVAQVRINDPTNRINRQIQYNLFIEHEKLLYIDSSLTSSLPSLYRVQTHMFFCMQINTTVICVDTAI